MVSSTDGPYKVHMKSVKGYLCKQNFRICHLKQFRRPDFNIFSYVAIKEPSKDSTFRYCACLINSKIFLLIAHSKIPNVRPGLIDIRKHSFFLFFGGGGLTLWGLFNLNHPNITTYVETMARCHYLLDALANGGLIRYGIKVQSFITV